MDTDHLVDFIGEVADQGYRLIDQAKSSELCKPRKGSLALECRVSELVGPWESTGPATSLSTWGK